MTRQVRIHALASPLLVLLIGCGGPAPVSAQPPAPARQFVPTPTETVRVLREFPHDPNAFTQGLLIEDGTLYESTGDYGRSTLRIVDLQTGRPTKVVRLNERLFAEGLVAIDTRLIQLTWQAGAAIVYDRATLRPVGRFNYPGEGWGLTTDGTRLYLSDGTPRIRVLDPTTFRRVGVIDVAEAGRPVAKLNELEWVEGELFANVWHDPRIARIDPATGDVVGWLDGTLLVNRYRRQRQQVLNGIAYDREAKRLFVTGKEWSSLLEIAVPTAPGGD